MQSWLREGPKRRSFTQLIQPDPPIVWRMTQPSRVAERPSPHQLSPIVSTARWNSITRVSRDAGRIAEEIIQHLSGLVGAKVTITLEIDAEIPSGVPDNVVRTVTENSRTLKFKAQGLRKVVDRDGITAQQICNNY